MRKVAAAAAALAALLVAGYALAGAVATTGTVSVCATATVAPQTIQVNGNPVLTLAGATDAQCATTTYTVPTETTTATQTVTTTVQQATTTAAATTTGETHTTTTAPVTTTPTTTTAPTTTAATTTAATTTTVPTPPPPSTGSAVLWVTYANPGTCTRSAMPITLATATSENATCGGAPAALTAAQPGDTVLFQCGAYGSQKMIGGPASGPPVTFQADTPHCATITGDANGIALAFVAAHWMTFADFVIDSGTHGSAIAESTNTAQSAHDIGIVDNWVDIGQALVHGGPILNQAAGNRWTITGNTFGPAVTADTAGCTPHCASPMAIRVGKPSIAAATCQTESCGDIISGNTIQFVSRNTAFWPAGYPLPPGASSCLNADGCHADAMQLWGVQDIQIDNNIMYGDECQGIYITVSNGAINRNVDIIGNAIASLAGGCSNKSIYLRFDGITSGTWNVGFNSTPQLIIGGVDKGVQPGTTLNLYGNYGTEDVENATGSPAGCSTLPNANLTVNDEYNTWLSVWFMKTPCGATDTMVTTLAWVNNAAAPAGGQDLHLVQGAGPRAVVPTQGLKHPPLDAWGVPYMLVANAGADQS